MSAALRMPEVTVGSYYRKLREAELLSKSGRGRSAAETTPLDAARLLIGILSSSTIKDVEAAMTLFAGFFPCPSSGFEWTLAPELKDLGLRHRLDEAVATIIGSQIGDSYAMEKNVGFKRLSVSQRGLRAIIQFGPDESLRYLHEGDPEYWGPRDEDSGIVNEFMVLSRDARQGLQPVFEVGEDVLSMLALAFRRG